MIGIFFLYGIVSRCSSKWCSFKLSSSCAGCLYRRYRLEETCLSICIRVGCLQPWCSTACRASNIPYSIKPRKGLENFLPLNFWLTYKWTLCIAGVNWNVDTENISIKWGLSWLRWKVEATRCNHWHLFAGFGVGWLGGVAFNRSKPVREKLMSFTVKK